MSYTFQAVEDPDLIVNDGQICNIIDGFADYGRNFSLTCGKIKALFGQPLYETENFENIFSYCILATSEDGTSVYLEIYSAGTGPAIGGEHDEASRKAANALVDYIRQAEPVDYAYKGYYMDGPTVLELGIKDGVPYYHEEELKLSDQEFRELYARLYGL